MLVIVNSETGLNIDVRLYGLFMINKSVPNVRERKSDGDHIFVGK